MLLLSSLTCIELLIKSPGDLLTQDHNCLTGTLEFRYEGEFAS